MFKEFPLNLTSIQKSPQNPYMSMRIDHIPNTPPIPITYGDPHTHASPEIYATTECVLHSGDARVFAARGKRLCCRPHPCNQIFNWYSYGHNGAWSKRRHSKTATKGMAKTATNQNGESQNGDKKRLYCARLASTYFAGLNISCDADIFTSRTSALSTSTPTTGGWLCSWRPRQNRRDTSKTETEMKSVVAILQTSETEMHTSYLYKTT